MCGRVVCRQIESNLLCHFTLCTFALYEEDKILQATHLPMHLRDLSVICGVNLHDLRGQPRQKK